VIKYNGKYSKLMKGIIFIMGLKPVKIKVGGKENDC
jgi:hypothetical protein